MYLLNYIHLLFYLFILSGSYYLTFSLVFPYNLLTSVVLGWSLYAMVTIGHDCMHQTFSPYANFNKMLSFICLNGIVMPNHIWMKEHQFHHANPGHPDDHMILDGRNFFHYIKELLLSKHDTQLVEELSKVPLLVALLCLPLYCVPVIWLTTLTSFAYLSLVTHIVDPNIRTLDHTHPKVPEEIAVNIFPRSHLFTFLAGGLNIHATHHMNPRWTRSQLMEESKDHKCKSINTIMEFWQLINYKL